jgi:hypothetical protein
MSCEYTVLRAAGNLPQSTQSPIFTVSGGRVLLTALIPEVTTTIQNQANSSSVYVNPTVGGDVLVWSVGNIQANDVGMMLGVDLSGSATTAFAVVPFPLHPLVVPAGTIDLSCPVSNTGQLKWLLKYVPLDAGATVTAA